MAILTIFPNKKNKKGNKTYVFLYIYYNLSKKTLIHTTTFYYKRCIWGNNFRNFERKYTNSVIG